MISVLIIFIALIVFLMLICFHKLIIYPITIKNTVKVSVFRISKSLNPCIYQHFSTYSIF